MPGMNFNLEQAIDDWCRAIIEQHCASSAHLDELKDHMFCLVESLVEQGIPEQQAFRQAIEQMGDSDLIAAEYAKNTHLLQKIAAFDRRLGMQLGQRFSAKQLTAFVLLWSVFAALMMVWLTALFPEQHHLTYIILAIWFGPYAIAASVPQVRRVECIWWRRLLRR